MPSYSYLKAKESNAITEADTKRMIGLFLALHERSQMTHGDYEQAAHSIGSTPSSIKVGVSQMFKKLRENKCYIDIGDEENKMSDTTPPARTSKGKRTTGHLAVEEINMADEEGGIVEETIDNMKTPKKSKTSKTSKQITVIARGKQDVDGRIMVISQGDIEEFP